MSYYAATAIIDPADTFGSRMHISDRDGTPIGVVAVSDNLKIQSTDPDALDRLAATLTAVAASMRTQADAA